MYGARDEAFAPGWRRADHGGADDDRRTAARDAGRNCLAGRVANLHPYMPVFAYRGLSPAGQSVAGVIDADSPRTARGKLRELGIFPTDLAEEEQAQRTRSWRAVLPSLG